MLWKVSVNSGSLSINSCEVPDDHVLMIGEDNIRNAEPHGDSKGNVHPICLHNHLIYKKLRWPRVVHTSSSIIYEVIRWNSSSSISMHCSFCQKIIAPRARRKSTMVYYFYLGFSYMPHLRDISSFRRLLAIFLLFVTGVIGMFKFVKLRKRLVLLWDSWNFSLIIFQLESSRSRRWKWKLKKRRLAH